MMRVSYLCMWSKVVYFHSFFCNGQHKTVNRGGREKIEPWACCFIYIILNKMENGTKRSLLIIECDT